jgi:hypothetical protein
VIAVGEPVPEVDVFDGKGAAPLPVFFAGPALLLFFRSGCRRCRGMLGLAAGIGRIARGLTVIGVSQETIEDTAGLLQAIGVRLPVVIDDRPYPASGAFGVERVPALALIEDDRIAWTSDGCPAADLGELTTRLAPWTKGVDVAMVPEHAGDPPVDSKSSA